MFKGEQLERRRNLNDLRLLIPITLASMSPVSNVTAEYSPFRQSFDDEKGQRCFDLVINAML